MFGGTLYGVFAVTERVTGFVSVHNALAPALLLQFHVQLEVFSVGLELVLGATQP